MSKNESGGNKYDTNKRFSDDDRKREKRIKSPVSTGSKRSKERNALRKVVDIFTVKGVNVEEEEDEDLFDDFEE